MASRWVRTSILACAVLMKRMCLLAYKALIYTVRNEMHRDDFGQGSGTVCLATPFRNLGSETFHVTDFHVGKSGMAI